MPLEDLIRRGDALSCITSGRTVTATERAILEVPAYPGPTVAQAVQTLLDAMQAEGRQAGEDWATVGWRKALKKLFDGRMARMTEEAVLYQMREL